MTKSVAQNIHGYRVEFADGGETWVKDGDYLYFGDSKDVSACWDGTDLDILPVADDTGAINIGNGTLDIDFKVFFGTTGHYFLCDVGGEKISIAAAPSGSSAVNALDMTIADACTLSSGYAHGLHIGYTKSGTDTGGGCATTQHNAIGIDYTISGGGAALGYNGMYVYMARSGTPTLTNAVIFPVNLDVQEMGATDYLGALWLQKSNTTKGTSIDAFILMSLQGSGVAKTAIYFQGTQYPDNFLQFASATAQDMLVAATPTGTTVKYLKVDLGGDAYAIEVKSVA